MVGVVMLLRRVGITPIPPITLITPFTKRERRRDVICVIAVVTVMGVIDVLEEWDGKISFQFVGSDQRPRSRSL